jgi:hypothetical protein
MLFGLRQEFLSLARALSRPYAEPMTDQYHCPICDQAMDGKHRSHSPEGAMLEVLIQIRDLLKKAPPAPVIPSSSGKKK